MAGGQNMISKRMDISKNIRIFERKINYLTDMKKLLLTLLAIPVLFAAASCNKNDSIGGEQDSRGEVGTVMYGSFSGADNINVSVTKLDNGVSTVGGTFTMTDERYMKIIKQLPNQFSVDGDKVTIKNIKFRATDEGVENLSGIYDGVLVKYDAKVGDTYSNGGKVTHVSEDNDFQWGSMKIKVVEVQNSKKKVDGVKKVTYWGNHRFGIVAVETEFEDGTSDYATISIF